MTKRILSFLLVISLLAGMGVLAHASHITAEDVTATQSVQAVYQTENEPRPIISVDIEWKGMSFTYSGSSKSQWDAEKHGYISSDEGYWKPSDAAITIANHSNAIIRAGIDYQANTGFSDTKLHFTDSEPIIGSAETSDTDSGTPCVVTIRAIPGGKLPSTTVSVTNIGTITVSVNADLGGSDPQIAAFERLYDLHEQILRNGYDPEKLDRGTVYYKSFEIANQLVGNMDDLGGLICDTSASIAQRNTALNELITAFYSALEIKQENPEETN